MKVFVVISIALQLSVAATPSADSTWLLIDDFESKTLTKWQLADTDNQTKPRIENPQVTILKADGSNHYLLKKPAADGIIGNRKALTFKALPQAVAVGKTYTFYTRLLVEKFPNNHAFGLSNLGPDGIKQNGYNAFEPILRVTDKAESNGFKNDGTLMVKVDSDDKYRQYHNVKNVNTNESAEPMMPGTWYQVWYVVNNSAAAKGGQTYDVFVQGGEFTEQTQVYRQADFRMKREAPLIYFLANCNTGPVKKPYGNGGLAYDDIYMAEGINLSNPTMQ